MNSDIWLIAWMILTRSVHVTNIYHWKLVLAHHMNSGQGGRSVTDPSIEFLESMADVTPDSPHDGMDTQRKSSL